jgi:hypothetical protein
MNTRSDSRLITTALLLALITPQAIGIRVLADSPAPVQPAPTPAEAAGTWQTLTVIQDGFSVLMPEPVSQQALGSPGGVLPVGQTTVYMAHFRSNETTGGVAVFSMHPPHQAIPTSVSEREATLRRMHNTLFNSSNSYQLLREQALTLDGIPGREFEVDMSPAAKPGAEKQFLRQRIYITQQHIYQLMVYGSAELVHSADADRFFNSFKLLAEPTPTP